MASETPPKQTSAMRSSFSRTTPALNQGDSATPTGSCRENAGIGRARPLLDCRCGIDPGRLVTLRLQGLKYLLPVRLVAGLDRDVELGAFRRHVQEQPPVLDLENVGAELAEPGGDMPEHAGPVGDGQAKRDDAVLAL